MVPVISPKNSPATSSGRVRRVAPPTLFCLDDMWVQLTRRSHRSTTEEEKASSFFSDLNHDFMFLLFLDLQSGNFKNCEINLVVLLRKYGI